MFNLGYKEVILNRVGDNAVYSKGGMSVIAGYGEFDPAKIKKNKKQEAIKPVGEKANWAYKDLSSKADMVSVKITLTKVSGVKESISFEAKPDAASIIKGFKEWKKMYADTKPVLALSGTLTTEIQKGFENWEVSSISVTPIKLDDLEARKAPVHLKKTVVTEGNSGLLYGYMLEESRRFGTFANTNPYSEYEGGNSQGIVMDGKYTAYYITYENDAERNHEFVKHSYVNAEMNMNDYSFVVYVLKHGSSEANFEKVFPLK